MTIKPTTVQGGRPISIKGTSVNGKRITSTAVNAAAAFGPGPNAPSWSGKTTYPDEKFLVDLPISPAAESATGFLGYQGFSGTFDNVTYPEVSTPFGTKRVIRVTFPGQTESLTTLDATTTPWSFRGTEYSNAGIRVTGTWSGTLTFERSTDGGTSWSAFTVSRVSPAESITSTTTNGWFNANTGASIELIRVRASAWTSGTAIVSVGMQGGQAPARFTSGRFNASQGKIYTRLVYRTSANWSSNGNTGTKFFFFQQLYGDGHYVNLGGDSGVAPVIALQPERSPNGSAAFLTAHDVWIDLEMVWESNTPGIGNGVGKAWVNGVLCVERTDFAYFDTGDTPAFTALFFDPTYGGGTRPPPANLYLDIAYWYRESAP
jgi:hypothetical protein